MKNNDVLCDICGAVITKDRIPRKTQEGAIRVKVKIMRKGPFNLDWYKADICSDCAAEIAKLSRKVKEKKKNDER